MDNRTNYLWSGKPLPPRRPRPAYLEGERCALLPVDTADRGRPGRAGGVLVLLMWSEIEGTRGFRFRFGAGRGGTWFRHGGTARSYVSRPAERNLHPQPPLCRRGRRALSVCVESDCRVPISLAANKRQ